MTSFGKSLRVSYIVFSVIATVFLLFASVETLVVTLHRYRRQCSPLPIDDEPRQPHGELRKEVVISQSEAKPKPAPKRGFVNGRTHHRFPNGHLAQRVYQPVPAGFVKGTGSNA